MAVHRSFMLGLCGVFSYNSSIFMNKPAVEELPLPPSILLLPDGNRRWARMNGVTYEEAYMLAAECIVDICVYLAERGMSHIWLGLVRPFNYLRPGDEVQAVLDACLRVQPLGRTRYPAFNVTVQSHVPMPGNYSQRFEAQTKDTQ